MQHWINGVAAAACLAHFTLAAVGFRAGAQKHIARTFAMLCAVTGVWTAADWLYDLTQFAALHYIDVGFSPLTAVLALELCVEFAGARLHVLRRAAWVALTIFGGVSAAGFWLRRPAEFERSVTWGYVFIALVLPIGLSCAWVLIAYLRKATELEERLRAAWLLGALLFGVSLNATELAGSAGADVPRLGAVGNLGTALLLAAALLRWRLVQRHPQVIWSMLLSCLAVTWLTLGWVFVTWPSDPRRVWFAVIVVTLPLMIAVFYVGRSLWDASRRRAHLRWLGQVTDHMTHDLANPLMALSGALEVIRAEQTSLSAVTSELWDVATSAVMRMRRAVAAYRRFGYGEPLLQDVQINALVADVVTLWRTSCPSISFTCTFEVKLATFAVDIDLITAAIENLLRNSANAVDEKGTVSVNTSAVQDSVLIRIGDDGRGMSQRECEAALRGERSSETGRGVGLAFVQRVAALHKGTFELSSQPGKGTVACLKLPLGMAK